MEGRKGGWRTGRGGMGREGAGSPPQAKAWGQNYFFGAGAGSSIRVDLSKEL